MPSHASSLSVFPVSLSLIIGNKNYSSWSLRAWLFLHQSGLEFTTLRLPLFTPQWEETIGQYSPARKVPVLRHGEVTLWDSQAIMAYCQQMFSGVVGWPADPAARALALSIAAEMHSGFLGVRTHLPQNLRSRQTIPLAQFPGPTQQEIDRIQAMWADCHQRFGQDGPWLFGSFTVADVMYAPVALRFVTYGVPVRPDAAFFMEAVQALPAIQQWCADATAEVETLPTIDELYSPTS